MNSENSTAKFAENRLAPKRTAKKLGISFLKKKLIHV